MDLLRLFLYCAVLLKLLLILLLVYSSRNVEYMLYPDSEDKRSGKGIIKDSKEKGIGE